jgi:hypothetical protein
MQFKPRNPLVPVMARRSGAGVHQKSRKAQRQAEKRLLRRARDEAGFVQHTAMC